MLTTAEVGPYASLGTESKGKDNKRIRLEVLDPSAKGATMPDHLIGLLLGAEEDWPKRSRRSWPASARSSSPTGAPTPSAASG